MPALPPCAAGSGVKVEYAQGMDLMGQIHYDWPLETALKVLNAANTPVTAPACRLSVLGSAACRMLHVARHALMVLRWTPH